MVWLFKEAARLSVPPMGTDPWLSVPQLPVVWRVKENTAFFKKTRESHSPGSFSFRCA